MRQLPKVGKIKPPKWTNKNPVQLALFIHGFHILGFNQGLKILRKKITSVLNLFRFFFACHDSLNNIIATYITLMLYTEEHA
jgi:hypothetical protein